MFGRRSERTDHIGPRGLELVASAAVRMVLQNACRNLAQSGVTFQTDQH
eukprot:SAG31_NODE_12538_length_934_cov_0.894611_2_plen_48_part_01